MMGKRAWPAPTIADRVPAVERPSVHMTAKASGTTAVVDCTRGDSIVKALEKADGPVVLEINGMCQESVVVDRAGVTLRGSDPAEDGIVRPTAPDADHPLRIRARGTVVENLTIAGVTAVEPGPEAAARSQQTSITNSVLSGGGWGLIVTDAYVVLRDVHVHGNTSGGIAAQSGGWVTCTGGCSVHDNPSLTQGYGVLAQVNSIIQLTDSVISGGTAVRAQVSSAVDLASSSVTGAIGASAAWTSVVNAFNGTEVAARTALWADTSSTILTWGNSTFTGERTAAYANNQSMIAIQESGFTGRLIADEGSTIVTYLAQQSDSLSGLNWALASNDSVLRIFESSLIGEVNVEYFSRLNIQGASTLAASVGCWAGADGWADDPSLIAGTVEGCEHLVKPQP